MADMHQQQQHPLAIEKPNKKMYTPEEIRKMALGYRGKAENFDPERIGKKGPRNVVRQPRKGPKTAELPQPETLQTKATPQRNESIISEAIFGIDVSVTEIAPRQSFAANYSKIVDISADIYDAYRADEKQLDRLISREEVSYYGTAMMQLKLLEVKAKQGETRLTSSEKDMRKAVMDDTFNIPQPMYAYLNEIGLYYDKMGKETRLEIPDLPVTIVQNFGGYHAAAITEETHNLFEEIPSLGIAGDMVMALAAPEEEPTPNCTHTK